MATQYRVELSRKSQKYKMKVGSETRQRIDDAIQVIQFDPYGKSCNHIFALKGPLKGQYKYVLSGLRIIYEIFEDRVLVYISAIGPRGDIYK